MDISLINAGLAAGAALAALPVILHLFMRQQPKRIVFPALRLIRERQKRSKKKLRVKNWLLLLARMALLALMALALARPRIVTEASIGDREVPTAIGLVFDTSLSMSFKERDKTRLDEAKEQANEILSKTPGTSEVFVVDSAEPGMPPSLSPANARKRIAGLEVREVNRPLNSAIGLAYGAVAGADKPRHEVYVMTDLARSSWDLERPVEGREKAEKVKNGIKTFVLRLTPKDVHNLAVVEARPASEVVTEGEPLEITAKIRSLGPATSTLAELWLDGKIRDKKTVEIPSDGEAVVRFTNLKVDPASRLHQGEVKITGQPDPLRFDDVRYFTFLVKPSARVLVVSDLPEDATYIAAAIDPDLPPGSPRPYRVDRIRADEFTDRAGNLTKQYRCVFLNNIAVLSDAEWAKLSGYVQEGGGVVVGLGHRSLPESYKGSTAARFLPAALDRVSELKEPTTFGRVAEITHPLFARYAKDLNAMLGQIPVSRYWLVTPHESSRVLLAYADKSPALVERVFKGSKTGRILLWSTPLSRRPDSNSKDAWNEFPNELVGWSFLYLMPQTVAYVSGSTDEIPVFEAGHDVILPLDPARPAKNYLVQGPDRKENNTLSPPVTSEALVVSTPQKLGQWTVKPGDGNGTSAEPLGFSINPPASESQFVPLEEKDLNALFGDKKHYNLADSPDKLEELVKGVRIGRELFPWLMVLILLIVTLENLLANRFYRESGPRPAVSAAG
jgi:hypothetical protein